MTERVNKYNEKSEGLNIIRKLFQNRILFLLLLIFILFVFAGISYDTFATADNIKAVVQNMSIDAIVAIGMMILLTSGVFDLTVGSVLGFSAAINAILIERAQVSPLLSIIIAVAGCVCIGAFNGTIIAKVGVNHLIVGLAVMGIIRGIIILIIGSGITRLPESFLMITDIQFLGINLPVWYMIVIGALFSLLLRRTVLFRRYYYIGGNEKAAALSGINVPTMRIISFMLSSGLAGLSGILLSSRLSASIPTLGLGLEFRAITACILGGGSLAGGYGTVLGAVLGTLFMGLVNNLMVVSRISISWQRIAVSGILLIAVTIDAIMKKE